MSVISSMIIFPTGIKITSAEYQCLFYLTPDVEGWLRGAIVEKAKLRREALINEWRPKLFNDPDVTELPADSHALCNLIMSRTDYKSRAVAAAAQNPPALNLKVHLGLVYQLKDQTVYLVRPR